MTKSRDYQLDTRGELEAMASHKRDVLLLFDVDDAIHNIYKVMIKMKTDVGVALCQ